jgi:FixJ family two-component response regulator
MLSAYDDTAEVVTAMQSGATDYLVKPVDEQELLTKICNALRVNWRDKQRLADVFLRLQSLSDREREVMELFAAAKTTRQVANMLGISPKTVEKHRIHIFDKLNVESVPALIRLLYDVQS